MKYSETLKNEVRQQYKDGASQTSLAKNYGIALSTIKLWVREISRDKSPKSGRRKSENICRACHQPFSGRTLRQFCSPKCANSMKTRTRKEDSEVFVENSAYARHNLKKRIILQGLLPYNCAVCGSGPNWLGKPMPLILDHVNGKNNDNRLENLRFVCSNCDSQLATYKARNRKRGQR